MVFDCAARSFAGVSSLCMKDVQWDACSGTGGATAALRKATVFPYSSNTSAVKHFVSGFGRAGVKVGENEKKVIKGLEK